MTVRAECTVTRNPDGTIDISHAVSRLSARERRYPIVSNRRIGGAYRVGAAVAASLLVPVARTLAHVPVHHIPFDHLT